MSGVDIWKSLATRRERGGETGTLTTRADTGLVIGETAV